MTRFFNTGVYTVSCIACTLKENKTCFSLKIIVVSCKTAINDLCFSYTKQLSHDEEKAQQELKALLRWRRLRDEVQNSEEELQVLR